MTDVRNGNGGHISINPCQRKAVRNITTWRWRSGCLLPAFHDAISGHLYFCWMAQNLMTQKTDFFYTMTMLKNDRKKKKFKIFSLAAWNVSVSDPQFPQLCCQRTNGNHLGLEAGSLKSRCWQAPSERRRMKPFLVLEGFG